MLKKTIIFFIMIFASTCITAGIFHEAPMLTEKVKQGKLPPIDKRLPKKPLVVKVYEEIGQYGGVAFVATEDLSGDGYGDDLHMIGFETPINANLNGTLSPNVIEKWKYSEDFKEMTMNIRKGIKWSDGYPFTADDILFWWKDELHNTEIVPVIIIQQFINSTLEKIDDYTLKFHFDKPYPLFDYILAKQWGYWGKWWRPAHYLKQFNPNYVSKKILLARAEKEGFYTLKDYYNDKAGWSIKPVNPACPTLIPYVLKSKHPSYTVWERNPYYWKTDKDGNQLPYIDKIVAIEVGDVEAIQSKIISGQVDFAAWQTQITDYPVYKKYEKSGDYNTYLWKTDKGAEVKYDMNMNIKNKQLHKYFNNLKFRQAVSLSINRNEINDLLYFGKATPRAFYLLPSSKFYEKRWENYYAEYDPEKANKLLDEIGLKNKDANGYRLDEYGNKISFTIEYWNGEPPEKTPMTELLTGYFKKIGLNVGSRNISRNLLFQRGQGNKLSMTNWNGGGITDPQWLLYQSPPVPDSRISWGVLWGSYYVSDGKAGKKPPPYINKMFKLLRKLESETDPKERHRLGIESWNIFMKNVFSIGTVGMAPYPIIVNKHLYNIPKKGTWSNDYFWMHPYHPEQFFFKGLNKRKK
ncbi:MAG TPA: ABC transporter substrate-binding protein [Victivallales bacterium]|nr:ABC transporter substrate-binding protein [Victivallales bacterium]